MNPLGVSALDPIKLAPRGRVAGSAVILFDNGKCHPQFGNYGTLLARLGSLLAEAGANVVREAHGDTFSAHLHLPPGDSPELTALVRRIGGHHPSGVVLAISDAGVSESTTRLALALEAAGIPTVSLFTELGAQVGAAMAKAQAPSLPRLVVQAPWEAPEEVLVAEASRLFPDVMAAFEVQPDAAGNEEENIPWHEADTAEELYDVLTRYGLGDGLPVVLPTEDRVRAMLAATELTPQHTLIPCMRPRGGRLTVETLAVNAVMAGCNPEQFPVVIAAAQAMASPDYRLDMANVTTHASGNLVIVSGPYASKAGVSSVGGCLGPGARNRANLTIGRTLTLTAIHVAGARLGEGDISVLGTPAKIAYCFAEDLEQSPWPGLNVQLTGDPTATVVLVGKVEGPHNVLDQLSRTPQGLLRGVALAAASGAGNNSYFPHGPLVVMLSPRHAEIVTDAGWSRDDVVDFLYQEARVDPAAIEGRGIRGSWPVSWTGLRRIPVVADKRDLIVVVAGAPGGVQSAVAIPWGYSRKAYAVVEPPTH